jgi:hypothetical protein
MTVIVLGLFVGLVAVIAWLQSALNKSQAKIQQKDHQIKIQDYNLQRLATDEAIKKAKENYAEKKSKIVRKLNPNDSSD